VSSLIRFVLVCLLLLPTALSAADLPADGRVVVEFPGQYPALRCRATREGLICELHQTARPAYGRTFEIELNALEPGEWRAAELKPGALLVVDQGLPQGKPKSGDKLTFRWKFQFDPDSGAKLFERETRIINTEAMKLATDRKLAGEARDRFLETQFKRLCSERAGLLIAQKEVLELDELRALKTQRAVASLVATEKLTAMAQQQLVDATLLGKDRRPAVMTALRALSNVRDRLAKEPDAGRKNLLLERLADEWVASVEFQRQNIGWKVPSNLERIVDGPLQLQRVCEWQAAEYLYLQCGVPLTDYPAQRWLDLAPELADWLLRKRPVDHRYEVLKESEIARLQQESELSYRVAFVPWMADQSPDTGWAGATSGVALKSDIVGTILWQGEARYGERPGSVWLPVEAPNGLKCDLLRGSADATWCLVEGPQKTFIRIAPKAGRKSVDFEARIHHPAVQGPQVRWSRALSGEVRFPF